MGTKPGQAPSPDAIALAFRQALDAAQLFVGATAPNPPVGCAILDAAGGVLAVAAHQKAGTGHAEALAIAKCKASGLGEAIHTIVVTLEPCNHFGRTPPCSEAILGTPAMAVWIGAPDPNPGVVGRGAERLRAAGLVVRSIGDVDPDLAASARRLIAPFAKRMRTGLPWVTVKQALDADGSMIPPQGQKTFTTPASLTLAHQLRRRADAVLTGSGTILADAPEFTIRHVPDFAGKSRHLAILDRRGRVPADYLDAAEARGFRLLTPRSLSEALSQLAEAGALEVLVEAGPRLTESVLASPFWDEHFRITADRDGPDRIEVISRPHSFSLTERS
jgi:diaminohydroxyphosphoribosylaminopyrimidine deaminase/5-amino-6-(5-phosphoribosylamino)uracil reductase